MAGGKQLSLFRGDCSTCAFFPFRSRFTKPDRNRWRKAAQDEFFACGNQSSCQESQRSEENDGL